MYSNVDKNLPGMKYQIYQMMRPDIVKPFGPYNFASLILLRYNTFGNASKLPFGMPSRSAAIDID